MKNLAALVVVAAFAVSFHLANSRTNMLLDIVEAELAENQRKDAVRDQWMREHQSDLMTQIEARME